MPTTARRARAALAGLLTAALAGLLTATPTHAASQAPTAPTLVPAVTQISATWPAVANAAAYDVAYSTTRTFTKKTTKHATTTRPAVVLAKLKAKTDYWVRVRPTSTSTWSAPSTTRPSTNSPGYTTRVTVTAAGIDKVKVTWPRYKAARTLKVVASWDNSLVYNGTKTYPSGVDTTRAWAVNVNPAATSATLTVPAQWRHVIGSRAGHPVFVHLYATNGPKTGHSVTAFGYPSPPPLTGTSRDELTFASWNILSTTASADLPGRTWTKRAPAVEAGIRLANADVVAVQEASASQAAGRQYQGLVARLADLYAPAVATGTIEQTHVLTSGTAGESKSDHILYKPARVELVRSGIQSTRALTPKSAWDRHKFDRFFEWALLRSKVTGTSFYVVSTHLEQGYTPTIASMRMNAASAVRTFIAKRAAADGLTAAPILVMGDFNSTVQQYPTGPQAAFVADGYLNAAAAASTVRRDDTTSNNKLSATDGGFPTKPYRYAYVGGRIDYIFARNTRGVARYVNQMVLTGSGTFDERYRGSDHNLQWARIRLT